MLPIAVVILFSFNDPEGRFNYVWQGFTLDNWVELGRGARDAGRARHVAPGRPPRDARRDRARNADGDGDRPARLPRPGLGQRPRVPPDVDPRDRPRREPADALPEHDERLRARLLDDLHRPRHVHRQLHRGHGEGAPDRLRPAPRGGGDGPRRERVDDVPQDHAAAARPGDARGRAARLRALDRRLRDHVLRRRRRADVPGLRLGDRPRRRASAGERRRERDLPDCDRARAR